MPGNWLGKWLGLLALNAFLVGMAGLLQDLALPGMCVILQPGLKPNATA